MSPTDPPGPPDAPGTPDPVDHDAPAHSDHGHDGHHGRDAEDDEQRSELDRIEPLATALVAHLSDDPREAEALSFAVVPTGDDDVSIAVRPLAGADPLEELLGFTAPDDWSAVGIVSTARWANLADAEGLGGVRLRVRRRTDGRARIAYVVARSGASLVVLQQAGHEPVVRRFEPGHEHVGRMDDVCRRMLGLSTASPSSSPLELWTVQWLDSLVRHSAATPPRSWTEVAAHHPVIARLRVDADRLAIAADDVVELAAHDGDLLGWEELRGLCAHDQWSLVELEPEVVAWMDAGMFSRWAVAPYPEVDELLDDLELLLAEPLRRRLRAACRAWGLA